MKKLTLLLILIANLAFAQNQRFAYEYKFVSDSTKKENVDKEMMYLDITKDGSKFYSRAVFVSDSTMNAMFEKQIKTSGSMNVSINMGQSSGKVRFKVFKSYPDYKTYFITQMGRDSYKVLDDRELVWKILPDKETVGEFMAQKATTEMYGRKWTAWFTTDIPLQDGPYKFRGLPGLIVKISDASNSHVFQLKAVTKFKEETVGVENVFGGDKAIAINEKQYKKIYIENRNDPAKALKTMMGSGTTMSFRDASGKEMSAAEMIRNREKSAKENNLKNNNLLEIDLLK
ncbi:GLPGLI family protein [Halpernia frigidisoli]|uniref:GLPGLI family protein n=1 Tax=Halpernia frigidisoli TaxID=1125876 RepID=A0A1I3J0S0_9FLAO|nr:GLPGLI family protein [Halpernia frigidisoli]SFI53685.1 GLPGLI family protein [Halpernia frigidisoli]